MCSLEREKLGRAWSIMDREQQIIASTRDALLREVEKGSRAMRLLSIRVEEMMKDVKDIRCDRCKGEGRVPEREHVLWSRGPSIDKDDVRQPTEEVRRDAERLRREELAAAGVQIFDDSRLTKLINAGGATVLCCQLWAEGGGNWSRSRKMGTQAC